MMAMDIISKKVLNWFRVLKFGDMTLSHFAQNGYRFGNQFRGYKLGD
jgi:hypothetical protein